MQRRYFLTATAFFEGVVGLALLADPAATVQSILGATAAIPEPNFPLRVAGAVLVAVAVVCLLGRAWHAAPQKALLIGLLIYDLIAAVPLAYTGLTSDAIGPALWPAFAAHAVLALWSIRCLRESA